MEQYKDYLITSKLDLDLDKLKNSCYKMKSIIEENFKCHLEEDYNEYKNDGLMTPVSTKLYTRYNLLMHGLDEFHSLYFEIQKLFRQVNKRQDAYYIHCWLNIYQQGEFINWHYHYPPVCNAWHGFFCVDCEPSKTTYLLPDDTETIDIVSKNNLLVLGKSNGDKHKTWPWECADRDRITIAFDIVPAEHTGTYLNHWIPI